MSILFLNGISVVVAHNRIGRPPKWHLHQVVAGAAAMEVPDTSMGPVVVNDVGCKKSISRPGPHVAPLQVYH